MCARFARDPERTREAILTAAEKLIASKGFQTFTLDEVTQAAGVSKGGLLHHFPNKIALVTGLTQQMITEELADIDKFLALEPQTPGAFTRAFLKAYLAFMEEGCSRICSELCSELRNIPTLHAMVNAHVRSLDSRLANDGLDPATASIIAFAARGMVSDFIWGIARPANFDDIVARLVDLATPHSSSL